MGHPATYSASNQITGSTLPGVTHAITPTYDAAGDVQTSGINTYLYDAEGRLCAVHGVNGMTGYQYDAEGDRVGKGTITSMSCDVTANGYQPTSDYVLDQSGGQVTELAVNESGNTAVWQHTNVKADGVLIATYDTTGLHYYFNDPLGTRRAQTDQSGVLEQTCLSLPFGDQLNCTMSTSAPTEQHFTGKERDAESGLDYFGARYYNSNFGRWMSPDWSIKQEPVPYAKLDDPQSLNLYSYVSNNPLSGIDLDGHQSPQSAGDKVVIDAGHGDKNQNNSQIDPGASDGNFLEKDYALKVADATTAALKAQNIDVIQTRTDDINVDGPQVMWRVNLAKKDNASVLVSIHFDAGTLPKITGMAVIYSTSAGQSLAKAIIAANTVMPTRGARLDNRSLAIPKYKNGAGVIVEVGFINSASDRALVDSRTRQIGTDIASGIVNYIKSTKAKP